MRIPGCAALLLLPLLACAAAPSDIKPAATKSIDLESGIALSYIEAGPAAAPAVILLHGFGDSSQSFELNIDGLATRFHLFALDQRGHGDSGKPDCCYTQTDYAADVVAFMDQLGIARAIVIGHSMGALIAHKLAVEHPARVGGLVLIGGAPACDEALCHELAALMSGLQDPVPEQLIRRLRRAMFQGAPAADYFEQLIARSMKVPVNVWQRAMRGMLDENHVHRLAEIQAPVLIMAGNRDAFPIAAHGRLAKLIPNSTLSIYHDTGHFLHAEAPQRFVDEVITWIDDHKAGLP